MKKIALLAVLLCFAASACVFASAKIDPSPFGVNYLKWHYFDHPGGMDELRVKMKLMKQAGIYWDRDGFDYGDVHPKPDVWNWDFTDKCVALAKEEGINLCVILMGGPQPDKAETRKSYSEYVYQVVNRYKDYIKVWEIWNEPNIPSFWKNPNAKTYTAMLKDAYAAAKKADPTCTVLGGSANGPGSDWFLGIADNGGWDYCDAISLHPYPMSPNAVHQRLDLQLRIINDVVNKLGKKPIWITEDGWECNNDKGQLEDQAIGVFQIYVIALANNIANFDYFCMDNYSGFGFVAEEKPFKAKPSYWTMQLLTKTLGSPGPAAHFEGYLKLPKGIAGYVFKKPGNQRAVILWINDPNIKNDATATVQLAQKTGLRAEDVLRRPVTITKGKITITKFPVVITGADARKIGKVSLAFNPHIIPKGENMLFNGSLDCTPPGLPGAWSEGVFNAGSKEGKLATSMEGRNGSSCVSSSQATDAAWHNTIIPCEPGKKYRLTAWIKTKDATGDNFATMRWYSGNMWTPLGDTRTQTITGTQDWTKMTVEGTVPRDAMFVRIHLISQKNTGAVWFDDLEMVEE